MALDRMSLPVAGRREGWGGHPSMLRQTLQFTWKRRNKKSPKHRKKVSVPPNSVCGGVIVDDAPAFGEFLQNEGEDAAYVSGGAFDVPRAENEG